MKEPQMDNELSEGKIMRLLGWLYDKTINGMTGFDTASELAESYMEKYSSEDIANYRIRKDIANSLKSRQNIKAGTSGFVTGSGGIIAMPATLPLNITSVIYIQMRMIAAIAHIGGHDIKDDRVKSLVYACLAGNAAKDILKDVGIVVGTKITTNAIKNISGKTIVAINQKIGFRFLTKFGEKGAINLGKTVPLAGGIIGATFDSVTTNIIGKIAIKTFITD